MLNEINIEMPEEIIDENNEVEDKFSSENLLNMFIIDRLNKDNFIQ